MNQKPEDNKTRTILNDLSEEPTKERSLTPEEAEGVKGGMLPLYEEDPSDFGSTKGE